MKISVDARLPQADDVRALKQKVYENHRDIAIQLNAVSEGAIQGAYNAALAAPTSGVYAVGDFVRNSAPAELGTAGNKFVLEGWVCLAAPLTFVQKRFLTGN